MPGFGAHLQDLEQLLVVSNFAATIQMLPARTTSCAELQNVVMLGLPLLASLTLSPSAVYCDQRQKGRRPKTKSHNFRARGEPVKLFNDWLDAFKEELYTGLRGMYLMLLFMPVIMLSPICVGLGWGWHSWVELIRWTLERAGPAFIKWGQVSSGIAPA